MQSIFLFLGKKSRLLTIFISTRTQGTTMDLEVQTGCEEKWQKAMCSCHHVHSRQICGLRLRLENPRSTVNVDLRVTLTFAFDLDNVEMNRRAEPSRSVQKLLSQPPSSPRLLHGSLLDNIHMVAQKQLNSSQPLNLKCASVLLRQ